MSEFKTTMTDINFDSLFDRFSENIYQTSKGYIRQHIVQDQLQALLTEEIRTSSVCADVGGGLGQLSESLAKRGHQVDYFDISQKMCDHARHTLSHYRNLNVHCASFQQALNKEYDLITCQAVLEWLAKPTQGLVKLCQHVAEDGYLFLLFYNDASIVLRNLVRGNLNASMRDTRGDGSGLTPINPLTIEHVFNTIEQHGLNIQSWFGVRCFTDLQSRDIQKRLGNDALLEFERKVSERDPFRSIARYVGLIAKRRLRT